MSRRASASRPSRTGRRAPPAGPLPGGLRPAGLLLALGLLSACATASGTRTPLPDPAAAAARAADAGPDRPQRVTFGWQYADERGAVRGDGVLRFNPPDSLRLDLFSTGDASMSVALVSGELRTAGQIEDVQLPPPAFLYATAGLFRPGIEGPREGWTSDGLRVLSYRTGSGGTLVYRLREGRIVGLEERDGGRELRRLELSWPDTTAAWPGWAEYRDRTRDSRARWTVEHARVEDTAFPSDIYELPDAP